MRLWSIVGCVFFFFQAEDGIRDVAVTGVQTCALPISSLSIRSSLWRRRRKRRKARRTTKKRTAAPPRTRRRKTAPRPTKKRKSPRRDRKSTRLNSSHGYISYAVFCLKKKNHQIPAVPT